METVKDKITSLLNETENAITNKYYDQAKKILETILMLDPEHEEAQYVLNKLKAKKTSQNPTKIFNIFIENRI